MRVLSAHSDSSVQTIVTISHDRYFLDRVATQILALDGVEGAEHYDGDYTEYHDRKLGRREAEYEAPITAEPDNLVSVVTKPAEYPGASDSFKIGRRSEKARCQSC